MGLKAAAFYLQALRKRNIGSRGELMKRMELTDDSILERIEYAKEVKILSYFEFIRAVGGRADHVAALLESEDGPEAEATAAEFLDELVSGQDLPGSLQSSYRQTALAVAEQLFTHPVMFGRWLEYGERLLGGLDDKSG